jgi:hypothetical protein
MADGCQVPTIAGNAREDDSSPFVFRMTKNPALFPTVAKSPDHEPILGRITVCYLLTSTGDFGLCQIWAPVRSIVTHRGIRRRSIGVDNTPDDIYTAKHRHCQDQPHVPKAVAP